MRKYFVVIGCCLLNYVFAIAQHEDTLLDAPNTPFLKDLIKRNGHLYPTCGSAQGIVKPTYIHSRLKGQYLIKSEKDLYLLIDWTGVLYKAVHFSDSTIQFKRIDSTINLNYNGGGTPYLYGKELHVLGGYSFWKTNGTDKKFNEKDMQWDVDPLSNEIIPQLYPIILIWHDPIKNNLWIPYERVLNMGIKDQVYQDGKINPYCYRLDLKSKKWIQQGRTDPNLISILKNASLKVETEKGILFLSGGYLHLLDFEENKILRSTDFTTFQSFIRISHTDYKYYYNNTLYYYSPEKKKYDSLVIDLKKFEVLNYPIYAQEKVEWYVWLSLIILILITVFGILYKKNKVQQVPFTGESFYENEEQDKNESLEYSESEQNLIDLLMKKQKLKETATLGEINYVLGVKDKNIGLQKKVRSDVINSINKKHRIKTGDATPWIQSVRSEKDKRYLEYYIDSK